MGLDIDGYWSKLTYHWGYSGIHQIRAMAVAVAKGIKWVEAFDFLMFGHEQDKLWNTDYNAWIEKQGLSKFRQLLHFSDTAGFMVKDWILSGIDIRNSIYLGSLDKLYDELEEIRIELTTNPEKYQIDASRGGMKLFWMLYNLVKDESENGIAIHFH
jgi:hypothetical protein